MIGLGISHAEAQRRREGYRFCYMVCWLGSVSRRGAEAQRSLSVLLHDWLGSVSRRGAEAQRSLSVLLHNLTI